MALSNATPSLSSATPSIRCELLKPGLNQLHLVNTQHVITDASPDLLEIRVSTDQINSGDFHTPGKRAYQQPLSIFAHNVNGLLTKLIDVYSGVDTTDLDVFILNETGLNDTIVSKDVFPPLKFDSY